jgi:hypothetical protein
MQVKSKTRWTAPSYTSLFQWHPQDPKWYLHSAYVNGTSKGSKWHEMSPASLAKGN